MRHRVAFDASRNGRKAIAGETTDRCVERVRYASNAAIQCYQGPAGVTELAVLGPGGASIIVEVRQRFTGLGVFRYVEAWRFDGAAWSRESSEVQP
jgi:hypothetical protein